MKLILLLLIWGVAFALMSPTTWAQDDNPETSPAVYDYKTWDCRIEGNKAKIVGKYRVTIHNQRGAEHGQISYREDRFMKLKKLRAAMYDAEGNEVMTRTKKECEKSCGFGTYQIYSDNCLYWAEFKSQRYPVTLEVEYEYEWKSLFGWRGAVFQENVPVTSCTYQLSIDTKVPFRFKMYGSEAEPTITGDKKRQVYVWSIDSLPALEHTSSVPPGCSGPVRLEFFPERFSLEGYDFAGSDWSAVGEWTRELYWGQMLDGADINVEATAEPSRSFVKSLYTDIQQDIRYVAISIGIGGWKPHDAKSTLAHKYGDCKDMSNVLISQLRLHGVPAYPVLVLTRTSGLTDRDFPSFGFNHVITLALLGQDSIWMDPTCQHCPFGTLPQRDQAIPALVVGDKGGELRTTPAADWRSNATVRITHWTIERTLHARLISEIRVTGEYARYLRSGLEGLDNDETRRFIDRQFRGAPKKYRIETFELENVDNLDRPLIIKISGRTRKPARRLSDVIYFNPFLLCGLNGIEQTDLDDRVYPLDMVYPERENDSIWVTWDSVLFVDSVTVPSADSVSYPGGHFIMFSQLNTDGAQFELAKACYEFTVDTAQFGAFIEYRNGVKSSLDEHVKIYVR